MPQNRPAVSRDTRLLLTIALTAVATLWVLARIRFPERPPSPNPVPPVLAQLAPPSAFEDVVSAVAQVDTQVRPSIVPLDVQEDASHIGGNRRTTVAALRFRADLALVLTARPDLEAVASASQAIATIGWDAPSNLAIVRVDGDTPAEVSTWAPRRLAAARFVIAADAFAGTVSFRPVFVATLVERASPVWSGPVWVLPAPTDLQPGALIFNVDGGWMGLSIEDRGRRAIVPAQRVLALADRIVREGRRPRGWLGLEVARLTPALATATGAAAGVIVTWVDPHGPAAGQLAVTDSIEAVDGADVPTLEDWAARTSRLSDDRPVVLRVRRQGEVRDVSITPVAAPGPPRERPLGLTLRTVARTGAAIVAVAPGSAAEASALQVGDIITLAGALAAPTAAQVSRAFAAASRDRPLVVGITRGERHLLLTIERTW